MGWLWSSPPPKEPSNNNAGTSASAPPAPTRQPESGYSDPEIAKFMTQLSSDFGTKPTSASTEAAARPTAPEPSKPAAASDTTSAPKSASSSRASLWGSSTPKSDAQCEPTTRPTPTNKAQDPPAPSSSEQQPTPHLDPVSESQLPTIMSCRQAFDAAFYCQSIGSQFHSIYRQGEVRLCSDHWDDFWFCMRTRMYTGAMKEEVIKDHYRRRELRKYYGPGKLSSEDVWERRTELVPPCSAFREPLPDTSARDISDEEWQRLEIMRRRAIEQQQEAAATAARGQSSDQTKDDSGNS